MQHLCSLTKYISLSSASGSKFSSENKNLTRDIASVERMAKQARGDHADLVFKYLSNELSCIEIGLVDNGPHGTKELNEKRLETPKMIKNFYSRILRQYEANSINIKIVGIVIIGTTISKICLILY